MRGRKRRNPSSCIQYLGQMAVRQKVDPGKFFDCIVEAWEREKSECDQLKIACREKREDSAVFLFTQGSDILGQFPIPTQFLRGKQGKNKLEDCVAAIPVRPKKNGTPLKIEDLKPKMKRVNLRAKVLEIPEPNFVYNRLGLPALVSNVLIGDETGTVRMALWNKQIDIVSEGALIEIKNARVASFRGQLQLRVGKAPNIKEMKDENRA